MIILFSFVIDSPFVATKMNNPIGHNKVPENLYFDLYSHWKFNPDTMEMRTRRKRTADEMGSFFY